jgi:ADP-heptose:LPS heptosyltransferase
VAGGPVDFGVRKIVVLRANGIGDLMFSMPALDALRAAHPHAEIVLLGAAHHHELLANRPGPVDRVETVPIWPGVRGAPGQPVDEAEIGRFFTRMRDEEFDVAIQMHGGGAHSNAFLMRLGARLNVGLRADDAPPLDRWVRYVYFQPEVLRYLEVVALLGVTPTRIEPRFAVTDDDRRAVRDVWQPVGSRGSVVLNPGATDSRRRWSGDRFARVGDAVAALGFDVVVSGGCEDVKLAEEVVAAMGHPATSVAGRLSLPGLVGLLADAALVVSNDSGPLHLAAAVGTPTVGIYWCGNALNGGPTIVHRHRKAISWQLTCSVCGVDCTTGGCEHGASFVDRVTVDEVVREALDVLEVTAR